VSPSGAALVSTGNSSLSNDTFVLTGYGMPSVATCLYFQGTATTGGASFGDGVRCVAGTVIRLGTKTNAGGFSQYPTGADSSVSVRGLIPAVGGARFYQDVVPQLCDVLHDRDVQRDERRACGVGAVS
jgi:hypothetical protein